MERFMSYWCEGQEETEETDRQKMEKDAVEVQNKAYRGRADGEDNRDEDTTMFQGGGHAPDPKEGG